DELRKQLGELNMRLELMLADAPLDQYDQVSALKGKAQALVDDGFAQLNAGDLAKAAASIEAARNLLDGKPAAESAAAEPTAKQPETKQAEVTQPETKQPE